MIILYNLFHDKDSDLLKDVEKALPELLYYPKIASSVIDKTQRQVILNIILNKYISKNFAIELLPFVEQEEFYILNIPMDEETPPGRYLRPQAMAEEYITRKWAFPRR